MALVPKADVEHEIPLTLSYDLAARNSVLFPCTLQVGFENRVLFVLGPLQAIAAGCVADGIRFALFTPGVPHAIELGLVVVDDVRTHHGHFLPRLFRRKNRFVALTFPHFAVLAGGISNPRLASCLPGIPHLIKVAVLDDDRTIEILLPIGLILGTKDDHRFAPLDAILAFNQGNAFLWSP